jgi:hypothetical protein
VPVDALGNPTYYSDAEESDETRGPVSSELYIVPSPPNENSGDTAVTLYFDPCEQISGYSETAKQSILKGLRQTGEHDLGSFADYAD